MAHKAPGKSDRNGITIIELADMFPDEESARQWFESRIWKDGRFCPHCGSTETHEASHNNMPYRCSDCRGYFSIKTGTAMHDSRIPLRKWVFAIYLHLTSLKGVSSMKLHRDIGVSQKTAWYMLQRIRQAWGGKALKKFVGPVEVDETFVGGKEGNKHASKKLNKGRGGVGKSVVVGAKDRETNEVKATVIGNTTAKTLQGFVAAVTIAGATVYGDDVADVFVLTAHETGMHAVTLTGLPSNVDVFVYDDRGRLIAQGVEAGTSDETVLFPGIGDKQYRIEVRPADDAVSHYEVYVENTGNPIDHGPVPLDRDDNSFAQATEITDSQSIEDAVGFDGDEADYYVVRTAEEGARLTASLTDLNDDLDIVLYRADGFDLRSPLLGGPVFEPTDVADLHHEGHRDDQRDAA